MPTSSKPKMTRDRLLLAVLSTADGQTFSPVQIQKMMFILDRNLGKRIGGPHFRFVPYNYGPFDPEVYTALDMLSVSGKVERVPERTWTNYRIAAAAMAEGKAALASLPPETRDYVTRISLWVRSLSFNDLVSAVYRSFPDMRVNSVFTG